MGRMSFPVLWGKWIKECISTATASVLVNGSPTDEFPLERGLRQGDPLSPFLFLVAAEGLHAMMKAMVERNLFTGYRVGESDSVSISHLQFANDTLLLGEKSWANVRALRTVLVLFETMSGLKGNFNKSMLVGVNIPDSRLREAASSLCCSLGKIPFMYLSLPIRGDPRRLRILGKRLGLTGKLFVYMLVDREGLWFRVLTARYGVEKGSLRAGGRRGSSWWREIASIRDGGGGIGGGWFREHVVKKVGDGSDTFFCTDPWVDEIPLSERFGRLFDLTGTKSTSVAEMFSLGWGAGGEAWVWRRQLRVEFSDRWFCQSDPSIGYTVRGAYQLLTSQDSVTLDAAEDLIWHGLVPLKVSVLAWRLLRDRLPTKSNLVARGILSSEAHHCVSGCRAVESAQHLFLSCSTFGSLWSLVSSSIGSSLVEAHTLSDHFVQFTFSTGSSRARRSFMQVVESEE
ncbi:hypothetical protein TSUD_373610 [Trifolium subterraneum]|uniref:Reverse transcriptase domain-containing protein n=1 Tax=Trifolium subterraneum TaxID=3900 RepID=A0A2Z6MQW6_TRISU|nr:hypothetical protein TSUD_373610 [Trifolium subterraneum]